MYPTQKDGWAEIAYKTAILHAKKLESDYYYNLYYKTHISLSRTIVPQEERRTQCSIKRKPNPKIFTRDTD